MKQVFLVFFLALCIVMLVPPLVLADRGQQIELLVSGVIDSSGNVLSGGKVYTYEPGTTTDKTTYTDITLNTPATNPVILDSVGQALVYGNGGYKLVIHSSDDVLISTIDSIWLADQTEVYVASTVSGSGDAIIMNLEPTLAEYSTGMILLFEVADDNTGATTINIDNNGTKNIKKKQEGVSTALVAGDLKDGDVVQLYYDGIDFILQDPNVLYEGDIGVGAVTTTEILDGTIAAADIATDAVTSDEIGAGEVGTSEIENNSVASEDIAADTIAAADIATGAVTTDEILDGTIANADMAADSVTSTEIANDSIGNSEMANNAIGNSEMADDAVDTAEIADDAIIVDHISDGAVETDQIKNNAVTVAKIAADAVQTSRIQDDAVTAAKIVSGAVGSSEVEDNSLVAVDLAPDSVDTSEIAAGAVDTDELATDAVDATKIATLTSSIRFSNDGAGCTSTSYSIINSSGGPPIDQAGAADLTHTMNLVNGANASKGVKLPTGSQGSIRMIINNSDNVLYVYPGTGDEINNNGANDYITMAGRSGLHCIGFTNSYWMCTDS